MMSQIIHFTVEKCLRLLPALTALLMSLTACSPLTPAQLEAVKAQGNLTNVTGGTSAVATKRPLSSFSFESIGSGSQDLHFTAVYVANNSSIAIVVDRYQGVVVNQSLTLNPSDDPSLSSAIRSLFVDSSTVVSQANANHYTVVLYATNGNTVSISPAVINQSPVQFDRLVQFVQNHL